MTPKRSKVKSRTERPPLRVFISHATGDKWIARKICEGIEAIDGAATFRDD